MTVDIRSQLVPLELLDITKCTTVRKTVKQMENCAIGARMLSEAAATMIKWIKEGKTPRIIYDNPHSKNDFFNATIESFALGLHPQSIHGPIPINSEFYSKYDGRNPVIVLGDFSHRWGERLFERGEDEAIFINSFGMAPPWVRDGYFKGFVNADPRLVLPILYMVWLEKTQKETNTNLKLIATWEKCGGVAAQAAHGFETFRQMINDPDCTMIATMSGIMTMAKMGGLISYMIDQGWVQAISATGALICHGLVEGVGLKHLKHNPRFSDEDMAGQKLNRIGTTVEPEENLDHIEEIFRLILNQKVDGKKPISPAEKNYLIGKYLSGRFPNEISILRSAYEKNIPVFIPAPDSELDNDQLIHNWKQKLKRRRRIVTNNEIDTLRLVDMATNSKKLGIFTLGGGVPRNWVQNIAPLIEIMNVRLNLGLPEKKFSYGCRICPDLVFLEHLSGCTYEEMKSWRKAEINGRFSEVKTDYSIVLPFYMAAMREIMEGK